MPFLPFKKPADIGGKPWIHGVGSDKERALYLKQSHRNSHMVVFGMTRVGKTRLMSIVVNQDIRNGEAVLVLDPKGDVDLIRDMYSACKACGREADFKILHAGLPNSSAKYNPLASFSNISEVATRVASAIAAEGEGKQFQDFAWKFLNTTATCLHEMKKPISYKSLAFYVTRPKQLLLAYCDTMLSGSLPDYHSRIEMILHSQPGGFDKRGKMQEPMSRADAIRQYVGEYIESVISEGNQEALQDAILVDLHHAAQTSDEYYGKITASLGPVFDKINKTSAGDIFSWQDTNGLPVIELQQAIEKKQVIYIGLDSMTNKAMSEAVGQAVIADLVSLCGRQYINNVSQTQGLCLHADEFSEIVRDEFITLLNKAGGAGINVSAYTQTLNDLGAVFGSNSHKYKMLLGNFGTTIMLRIANLDTAKVFTDCLLQTHTRSGIPSTQSIDKHHSQGGEMFATSNTDTIHEEKATLIHDNDLFSLPKGQAFVLTNGGELYKTRLPLPVNDDIEQLSIENLMQEINNV